MTTTTERNETRLNPPIEECDCGSFRDDTPLLHELLLGFEDYDVCFADEVVASLIGDRKELGIGNDLAWNDPDLFRDFVAKHNWRNPSRMADLADLVQQAAMQASRGREAGAPSMTAMTSTRCTGSWPWPRAHCCGFVS